jgi:hypothetical protein
MIWATPEINDEAYQDQADYEENFRDGKDKLGFCEYPYGCNREYQ